MGQQSVYTVTYSETYGGFEFIGVCDNKEKAKNMILEHMTLIENVDMEDNEAIQATMKDEYSIIESKMNVENYQEMF
jgi:hypothetical protein